MLWVLQQFIRTTLRYFPPFNCFMPSDTIWWHIISGSTLPQAMPCCLAAPSQYLSQCWPVIQGVLWQSLGGKFYINPSPISQKLLKISISKMCLKKSFVNLCLHLTRASELMKTSPHMCSPRFVVIKHGEESWSKRHIWRSHCSFLDRTT